MHPIIALKGNILNDSFSSYFSFHYTAFLITPGLFSHIDLKARAQLSGSVCPHGSFYFPSSSPGQLLTQDISNHGYGVQICQTDGFYLVRNNLRF